MSVPYFPLYVADYEADTAHLSLEEDGCYTRLLRLCWRTPGCSIPNDPKWIARMMRVTWECYERVVAPILSEFFQLRHNRYFSPRLQKEYERIANTSKARSVAGKSGNEKRWKKEAPHDKPLKTLETGHRPAIAKGSHPEPEPELYNSNANALDGEAVTAAIWDRGVKFLVAHGSTERHARSIIGKWRKEADDQAIFEAFVTCKKEQVVDPIPWITATLSQPKIDLMKLAQEIINEHSSPRHHEPDGIVSEQANSAQGDSWQRRGAKGRNGRAGPGRDEVCAEGRIASVVVGVRGRLACPHENTRVANPERD